MHINQIQSLQNATYELEGLLQLMADRKHDVKLLRSLIVEKSNQIAQMANSLQEDAADLTHVEAAHKEQSEPEVEHIDRAQVSSSSISEPVCKNDMEERTSLRKLFPLNDVFLYRRTLFNGSQSDFDASLALVSEMHTIEQACEYFYGDLQWNPEMQEVKDFMAIINRYFTRQLY